MKRFFALLLSFWVCFRVGSALIRGNPDHFETYYDADGKEVQCIWIGGERYFVWSDELTVIYYDDGFAIG